MLNNPQLIYDQGKKAWNKWVLLFQAAIAARYPETGGIELMVHNWYVCGNDKAKADEASAFLDSWWKRWRRIDDRVKRLMDRAEHNRHCEQKWYPHWCQYCYKPH